MEKDLLILDVTGEIVSNLDFLSFYLHIFFIFYVCVSSFQLLKERGNVSELGKRLRRGLSGMEELEDELRDSCMSLSAECQDLERHVNASLLQLFVDVFKETCEPVDRMVKAAFEGDAASVSQFSEHSFDLLCTLHWSEKKIS